MSTSPTTTQTRRRGFAIPTVREIHPVPVVAPASELLERAREDERSRIRQDLHDGVGAALAGLIMVVGAAHAGVGPGAREVLAGVERDLAEVARELRTLIDGLRPPALEELGLVDAIRRHADRLQAGAGVRIDIVAEAGLALPSRVERAAYRIVSEALTNVARHSGADSCLLVIAHTDDALRIAVSDDGSGLPSPLRAGVGTATMRRRAAELGGRCEWHSVDGGGTRVECVLPVGA